jgi:hypothetical protein
VRRFFLIVTGVTALAHVPFALALHEALFRLGGTAWWKPWLAVLVAGGLAAALRGRIALQRWDKPIPRWRMLLVEEPYYAHWFATVLTLPLMAIGMAVELVRAASTGDHVRVGTVALAAYLTALAVGLWAVVVRRRWVRVRVVDVPVEGLAPALDGYRIAQMSDLHIGSLCPRARADRWVDRVNRLDVDLVALTGDYVTSGVRFHQDIAGALSRLRGRDGVVAVMGNHDYFGDGEPLIGLLRAGGVRVLRNERMRVDRDGGALTIAGVDDIWTRRTNIAKTLDGWAGGEPLVVLAHDPKLFLELAGRGADLVLSGHTHWGQVAVPFLSTRVNLSRFAERFHAGLYREGASTLWINPGLGTTGPPIRLGTAPEVTILRLRTA